MATPMQNVFVKSWSTGGSGPDDADTFEFKAGTEDDAAADGRHDDWIPILDIHEGTHKPAGHELRENVTFTYETITNDAASRDGWFDFG